MTPPPVKFYAHSGNSPVPGCEDWQPLSEHLQNVADRARDLAEAALPGDATFAETAYAVGLLHDLGKYQLTWQQYLRDSFCELPDLTTVPHSVHGAAFALLKWQNVMMSASVLAHHSGLSDWPKAKNSLLVKNPKVPEAVLKEIVQFLTHEIPDWESKKPRLPEFMEEPDAMYRLEFWTRVLFSILIDADRLDTEEFGTGVERNPVALNPEELLRRLDENPPPIKAGTSEALNQIRNTVYQTCREMGSKPKGFFELTVPTGGGKTRSGMAFALAHAKEHRLRRIFVVIPYLSIIEQNAEEYRSFFGKEAVLEHHSAVIPDEAPKSDDQYRSKSPSELATENWDAPIVVTTSVQFLETLFTAKPRRARRLHNVARSVIFFDEAQCLPIKMLDPIFDIFRDLTKHWGCSIVFSTATQPSFRQSAQGLQNGLRRGEYQPILSDEFQQQAFRSLQRVNYSFETKEPWSVDKLVARLLDGSALCVLNTRKQAREVWEKLRTVVQDKFGAEAAERVCHLSSAMCAQHRTDILGVKRNIKEGTIYDHLRKSKPCWVVSTQVIEAGVDIDFPRVFRALGPLDSIVQAAGRCNREGQLQRGEVIIFRPTDEGMPPGIYQQASGQTATILSEITPDKLATEPALFADYFSMLYRLADTDDKKLQEQRLDLNFKTVSSLAKVIDGGRGVIVPYGQAIQWVRRIRRLNAFNKAILRRLQRYTVNLQEYDFAALRKSGMIQPLLAAHEDGPQMLLEGGYSQQLGVSGGGLTPEQTVL